MSKLLTLIPALLATVVLTTALSSTSVEAHPYRRVTYGTPYSLTYGGPCNGFGRRQFVYNRFVDNSFYGRGRHFHGRRFHRIHRGGPAIVVRL